MEGWKFAPNDLEQEQTLTDKVQLKTGNQKYYMQIHFMDRKIIDLVSVDSWTSCHGHDNPSHIGRHVWSCQVYWQTFN